MTLKQKRRKAMLQKYGEEVLSSQGFLNSEQYIQHGSVSVKKHSIRVALTAIAIAEFLKIKYRKKDLIRGALLHDYFQYDWHNKPVNLQSILHFYQMHGFTHPFTALNNAQKDFELTKREKDIISKHMWPLTVKPPMCREAWIVTMADKYCSLLETLKIHR